MKASLAVAALLLASTAAIGCGGASELSRVATSRTSTVAAATNTQASGGAGRKGPAAVHRSHEAGPYLNDGDKERVGDTDGDNNADNDNDRSLDYLPVDYRVHENDHYHDADDIGLVNYGRAASEPDERTVAALVERYYRLAAAGNGAAACALLTPTLARAAPSDYGEEGPAGLRRAKTCAGVAGLLFERYRRQLAAPTIVTGVRVNGNLAYALLGSHSTPASYIIVQREGGAWRLTQLLGNENRLP